MCLLALIFLFGDVAAVLAFRCGGELVTAGMSKTKVLLLCGEPTRKEKGSSSKSTKQSGKKSTAKKHDVKNSKNKEGGREERWYYNCGANDFIYVLTFRNDILESERNDGYGVGTGDCGKN